MASKKDNQGKLEKIATMAAEQTIKKYTMQETKKKKDYRFRNTKLLLKNYNSLNEHLINAKVNIKEIDDIIDTDYFNKDELYIESVRKSKLRTLIMLANIDVAMAQLESNMMDRNQYHKYEVIRKVYINQWPYETVASQFGCNEKTIRRWANEATSELSILLFGVDGMELDR